MATTPSGKGLTVPRNPAMALRLLNTQHADITGSTDTEATDKTTNKDTIQPSNKQTNNTTNNISDKDVPAVPDIGVAVSLPEGTPVDGLGANTGTDASNASEIPTPQRSEVNPRRKTRETTNKDTKKPTNQQTNNTTNPPKWVSTEVASTKRDGRTMRMRQPIADAGATVVTSFRLSAATMEALDEFCFYQRMRKQDVVQLALDAFMAMAEAEADGAATMTDDGAFVKAATAA